MCPRMAWYWRADNSRRSTSLNDHESLDPEGLTERTQSMLKHDRLQTLKTNDGEPMPDDDTYQWNT